MKQKRYRHFGLLLRMVLVAVVFALIPSSTPTSLAQSGGTLGYGSKVYGTISATTPLVTYSIAGQQGDFVAITADSWTGTLDLQLELVAPDGVVLDRSAQNTASAEALGAQLAVFLPQDGIYVLRLSGEGETVGDFLLTVLGRAAVEATPLHYGEAVDVTIQQGASAQYFAFEAEDCPTTLVVSDPSDGQPSAFPFVVKLRDQRGHTVAQLRGGQQLEDWVTVEPRSGRYEVEVLAADPTLSGSLRLLVTCSGDNPGCTSVAAGLTSAVCPTCPAPETWVDGGGCPDLGLTAEQDPANPAAVTVTWNPMSGANGYAVYVIGNVSGGGEVYLTHAVWTPGDPARFTWVLPGVGYAGFTFRLQALVDDVLLCTDETTVSLPGQYACPDLGLSAAMIDPESNTMRLSWFGMELVDGYQVTVFANDGGAETTLYTSEVLPPGTTSFDYPLPDGYGSFRFQLRLIGAPLECSDDLMIQRQQIPSDVPCAIRADRDGVAVRVGPGVWRSQFIYLLPGIEYTVIGQAADDTGALWWQLDKTQFAGHEAVTSLWVAQADVIALGDCTDIPQADIPPIVPPPEEPPSGGWGPCGSCDTCGFPAEECVTSPEGTCLWDPTTCRGQQPPPDDGGGQTCYAVSASIDMGQCSGGGSAMIDTVPNCDGGLYTPGTSIQAHARRGRSEMYGAVVERVRCIRQRVERLVCPVGKLHGGGAHGLLRHGRRSAVERD